MSKKIKGRIAAALESFEADAVSDVQEPSQENEVMADVQIEGEAEHAELLDQKETVEMAAEGLENVADKIEATLPEGGMIQQTAEMMQMAVESYMRQVGDSVVLPATESYGGSASCYMQTQAALESVKDSVQKYWNIVWDFIKKIMKSVKELAKKYFTELGILRRNYEDLVVKARTLDEDKLVKDKLTQEALVRKLVTLTGEERPTGASVISSLTQSHKDASALVKSLSSDYVKQLQTTAKALNSIKVEDDNTFESSVAPAIRALLTSPIPSSIKTEDVKESETAYKGIFDMGMLVKRLSCFDLNIESVVTKEDPVSTVKASLKNAAADSKYAKTSARKRHVGDIKASDINALDKAGIDKVVALIGDILTFVEDTKKPQDELGKVVSDLERMKSHVTKLTTDKLRPDNKLILTRDLSKAVVNSMNVQANLVPALQRSGITAVKTLMNYVQASIK